MLIKSQKGIALVLTLMILAIITAVVVEFAYGVYTSTSALYNWRDSQRLSFVAKSGMTVAGQTISNPSRLGMSARDLYNYLGRPIPLENLSEGFTGRVIIGAEDENGKFNLNSIVWPNGQKNAYDSFVSLLDNLGLDESIADRIADWIDQDSVPRSGNSEEGAKNGYLDSVDELLLIKGIDRKTYEKLLPYVTVYSYDGPNNPGSPLVNMNTASIPVIMSLGISREQAEKIVSYRKLEPFMTAGDLDKTGLDSTFRTSISRLFTVSPPVIFRVTSIAEENKIRRVIESVIDTRAGNRIRYWRET